MSNHLVVNDERELQEVNNSGQPPQPSLLRWLAGIISFVFHPLFIPVYLIIFYVRTQSHLFSGFSNKERLYLVISFASIYVMFPLVSILLLRGLGFVKTIFLKNQQERIYAYVICMIYYWWMWYVLKNKPEYPAEIVILALAIFLVSIFGLMANILIKVSMHAMAVGVAVTFIMMMGFSQDISFTAYISIAVLITGLVCTARLIVSDHHPLEIYAGLLIGILSQVIAHWFVHWVA